MLPSPYALLFRAAKAFQVTWYKRRFEAFFARSSRIRLHSPKWTDREGLGKCPTGTRQVAMEAWWSQHTWCSSIRTFQLLNFHFSIDGFHNDVIKLLSQNSEVLRILIYTRLKINKKWIFVQVSILVAGLISKIQQFELPSFHSARHQNGNAVSLKSLLLIFSSITISSIRRYFYAHVC